MSDAALIVTGAASSSKGIARVVVTLNGAEVHRQSESGRRRRRSSSAAPVTLRAGANTHRRSRRAEPDGTVRQEVRTVIFDARAQRRAAGGAAAAVTARAVGGHHRRRPLRERGDSRAALRGGRRRGGLPAR